MPKLSGLIFVNLQGLVGCLGAGLAKCVEHSPFDQNKQISKPKKLKWYTFEALKV